MKLFLAVALPVLVVAAHDFHHVARHQHAARQVTSGNGNLAPSAPPAPPRTTTSAAPPPPPPPPPPASQSSSAPPAASAPPAGTSPPPSSGAASPAATTSPTITYSFSLEATNPTAVPLPSIVSGASSHATVPLDSTYAPGSIPTFLPGAPPLPNAASLSPANYPPLDKPPPTDSPEVLAWIKEVADSGVFIPNISPTTPGGCPANPQAVADDANRCWWTCGGCTRASDVTTCPDKLTWGLTYDDGPAFFTPNLMNYLDTANLKSTFYVVGSRVISFPAMLQSQYMGQHQIGVHTWSHTALTTQSNEAIIAELGWSRKVIKDVLGVTPNTMRPPYGDLDDRVRAIALAMGLTPVIWTRLSPLTTFDTGDFNIAGGSITVQQVLQNWEQIIGNASQLSTGFIVLEHDLFQQSVDVATGYILPDALAHRFSIKPVISCLGKPLSDAYIETNDNKTNPPAISAATISAGGAGATLAGGSGSGGSGSASSGDINLAGLLTVISGIAVGVGALLV